MTQTQTDRAARFEALRGELAQLDDEALKERFWALCQQIMEPVVELARTHTSPSIERSVLLRMGIDSVTTHAVVENVRQAGLLGKGAGHAVLRASQRLGLDIPAAAKAVADNPSVLEGLFEGKDNE
ncbi:MAG: ornithine aminomutase subunit alpha [Propionibacteriaceae bacterium]|nr:ornithine aminomutase subunit alpha [Propionibacteriaceae bacterium]